MTLYKQRERFGKLSVKIGLAFSKLPLSANQWTVLSLVPAFIALYYLTQEQFLLAGAFFIVSAFIDLIDGSVARVTSTVSRFGAYLDTIVDRYVEVIIVFGLLFVQLPEVFVPAYAWIFLYLFGSMMTTYVKAAAKEKELVPEGQELKGGLLERAERLLILFVGILLAALNPLYLIYVVAGLAVLTNLSAIQRILIAKGLAT
ncbi:MAG: CDP-alcohol phosphatidyltransferase [Candidatus Diapherotrites archaeon]|uniref:CDP-alcohol phosphatidyltransferase n=1 Tax=Candidatus Iainarchaeum sp. TaxID=3101447 RepID=A0A2D6M1C8_9ARCH|nr:CDP-alcohol phosphatidyltransferase [Candidatus Diapherotrites archaeon]